jgi:hypothetical protein
MNPRAWVCPPFFLPLLTKRRRGEKTMTVLTLPQKHPAKRIFNEKQIPLTVLSHNLGISYHHLTRIMNGFVRPSKKLNEKIEFYAEEAEAGRLQIEQSA